MNTQKISFQERIQQKNGLVGDCSIEFGCHSSDYFGIQQQQQQPWNMRIRMQPPSLEAGGGSQHQILGPVRSSSSTILSRFESPASAFYATERYMGFPDQYDCQVVNPSPCSQFSRDCDSEFPTYQFSRENFPVISAEPSIELRDSTLQSIPKSDFCSNNNQYYTSSENSYRNPPSNRPFIPEQVKLLSGPFEENQDHRVGNSSYGSMNCGSQQEKQSPRFSLGGVSSGSSVSSGAVLSSKTRIRWTQDLHEKFVECVNRLGGAEKATPKAILRLMESDGLTIFHVKSHLQKYRMAKYIPDSAEGKSETRNTSLNDLPQLNAKTGLQIKEALQLQLDVQMRLHEQLEIQRNLQLRIEEQGRQLKMLFDQQQRTNSSSQVNDQSSDSTTHQDEPTFSLEDIEDSIAENSGNTHFPSKIS
ncbi:hypothetical protein Q3G72_016924 [Acer saccharum]|nr:hypothetical protein Q3G72_016924 [Acer saccharum]